MLAITVSTNNNYSDGIKRRNISFLFPKKSKTKSSPSSIFSNQASTKTWRSCETALFLMKELVFLRSNYCNPDHGNYTASILLQIPLSSTSTASLDTTLNQFHRAPLECIPQRAMPWVSSTINNTFDNK